MRFRYTIAALLIVLMYTVVGCETMDSLFMNKETRAAIKESDDSKTGEGPAHPDEHSDAPWLHDPVSQLLDSRRIPSSRPSGRLPSTQSR